MDSAMVRITVGTARIPKGELGISGGMLRKLADSADHDVRIYVAKHPNTPERVRQRLVRADRFIAGIVDMQRNGSLNGTAPASIACEIPEDELKAQNVANRMLGLIGKEGYVEKLLELPNGAKARQAAMGKIEAVCSISAENRGREKILSIMKAKRAIAERQDIVALISDRAVDGLVQTALGDMLLMGRLASHPATVRRIVGMAEPELLGRILGRISEGANVQVVDAQDGEAFRTKVMLNISMANILAELGIRHGNAALGTELKKLLRMHSVASDETEAENDAERAPREKGNWMERMTAGEALRTMRESMGMTREHVVNSLGITIGVLSRHEDGKIRIDEEMARRYCKLYLADRTETETVVRKALSSGNSRDDDKELKQDLIHNRGVLLLKRSGLRSDQIDEIMEKVWENRRNGNSEDAGKVKGAILAILAERQGKSVALSKIIWLAQKMLERDVDVIEVMAGIYEMAMADSPMLFSVPRKLDYNGYTINPKFAGLIERQLAEAHAAEELER